MTRRTWWFRWVTTVLILGLASCSGGGGGGGGGGGNSLPSASNTAITPPPSQAIAITTAGTGVSQTNQSIAANAMQSSNQPVSDAKDLSPLVGVQAANSGTPTVPDKLAALVRRQAEKIKDHQPSLTGALQVDPPRNCALGGTDTTAFDDANGNFTEVFVNCNEGGEVTHGTISATNVSVGQSQGSTVGSPWSIVVMATFNIDLSVVSSVPPASSVVTQGSFTISASFSGVMQAKAGGGVEPGPLKLAGITISGASLLSQSVTQQNGSVTELLSNFDITVVDDETLGRDTILGGYSFASTAINGSVRVDVTQQIVQPHGLPDPTAGQITITSSTSPEASIVVTVISSPVVGVRVDVSNGVTTDSNTFAWADL